MPNLTYLALRNAS